MLHRSRMESRSNNPNSLTKSTHIVEDNLQKQDQLLQRYRNSTQNYIDKMDSRPQRPKNNQDQATERKNARRQRLQSHRRDSIPFDGTSSTENVHDYQKLIMGLEYALELERKKREMLQNKNQSIETQVYNLRNLLGSSSKENSYERLAFKEYQDKISQLEAKVIDQKQNYEFIIDSKNEGLASLEFELRTLERKMKEEEKDSATSRKYLELMAEIEQLRSTVIKKNIIIERIRFHQGNDSESEQEDIKKMSMGKKIQYYLQQLQISNKLILRKNIEILNSNKKILKYEEVLDVIEHYLDKKEVKNVDLNILEHACVNKLRLMIRQKSVFERELLNQLNQQNKRIASFEKDLVQRDSANGGKVLQLINDNKRLAGLANTLQNTIKNLQKDLQEKSRDEQIMQNQLQINKKQFTDEILRLKDQINTLSSVTKTEFDRMKLQNNKLLEQNRSLVALLGDKDRQVSKNQNQKRISEQPKQKNPNTIFNGDQIPQIGNKLVLINTFTQWVAEWGKVKKWQNKKVLLNIILDKTQIRTDSLKDISSLINCIHDAFLNSRNIEVEERAIILLSHYLQHNILNNVNLYLDKISPILVKGLRPIIQNQQPQIHRILNESALKILNSMQKNNFRWQPSMTHQMISSNGMKTLFHIITNNQNQDMTTFSYSCLIMIAKSNEMIPIMNSFSISNLLVKNMNTNYQFILSLLHLLKELLRNREFVKAQKSIVEFKQLFKILKEEEQEDCAELVLDCLLLLLENTSFIQNINKLQCISILGQAIKNLSEFQVLKKIGILYQILVPQLEHQQIPKMAKQISKLIDILKTKKFTQNRFNRSIRIILKIATILNDNNELDQQIMKGVTPLYEYYDQLDPKGRIKLNGIVNTIFQRNKNAVNRYSNQKWIIQLIEAYKNCQSNEELIFLLKILLFQHEQKRSTQIIRNGRDGLIKKFINDSLNPDYTIALPALKNIQSISKQKYAQKFIHQSQYETLVDRILLSRSEQQFLGTTISILYYFCKNQQASAVVIEMGLVPKMFKIMTERHQNDGLIYKCLTLLELCHTTNYKRRILNYLLSDDHNMQILKTLNFILKKAKNKQQMGSRAVFIYDFLNGKSAVDSFAIIVEQNIWMVNDLVDLRNQYVSKVDDLVYKVELLLHNISNLNPKVRKAYEKFRVEGNHGSEDES